MPFKGISDASPGDLKTFSLQEVQPAFRYGLCGKFHPGKALILEFPNSYAKYECVSE